MDEVAKKEENKVQKMIGELYDRLLSRPAAAAGGLSPASPIRRESSGRSCDYISGMSDEFAIRMFVEQFVPQKLACAVTGQGPGGKEGRTA